MRRRRRFPLRALLPAFGIFLALTIIGWWIYGSWQYDKTMSLQREKAAIRALDSIQIAQAVYRSNNGRYATSMAELEPQAAGHPYGYELIITGRSSGYG